MEIGFTAAVLSGELRNRLDKTAKSINSLNNQTHKNLQKILVNGGSPPHQTQELLASGINLDGWTILDFPIDAMDISAGWSTHRWNGQAALHATEKEFFFAMNDDDFLSSDFFERIAKLFSKYPSAVTGMGLSVSYYHETDEFGTIPLLDPYDINNGSYVLSWKSRPECEPGIDLVRKTFFIQKYDYNPNSGFQPVCRTDLVRDVAQYFFSEGGHPDYSSYFQMVVRGDTVFDPEALMYWGKHSGQDHFKMRYKHFWFCSYKELFRMASRNNTMVFKRLLPENLSDAKKIKRYFNQILVSASLLAILDRYSVVSRLRGKGYKPSQFKENIPVGVKFPLFRHLLIAFKNPIISIKFLKSSAILSIKHVFNIQS